MKRVSALGLLAALACCGCATKLIPEAETLRVVDASDEVRGCTPIGAVRAHAPYITPSDGLNEMKNAAASLGGDTLFLTNYAFRGEGVAYRCRTMRGTMETSPR